MKENNLWKRVELSKILSEIYEIRVRLNGWFYIIIYGKYSEGWFISIPNRKISTTSMPPEQYDENAKLLNKYLKNKSSCNEISIIISEHFKNIKKK